MKQTNNNKFLDTSNILSIDIQSRKLYDSTGALSLDWSNGVAGGGFNPAKVRNVYLVNETSDAAAMGGPANNVYTTAQAAYDAADALQQGLGGANIVVILVGNTKAANVGDITLAANWNKYVYIAGIDPKVSEIGNIIATNLATNGFDVGTLDGGSGVTYPLYLSNVKIGDITTTFMGTMTGAEHSGNVTLALFNVVIGNIDTSISDLGLTGVQAGILSINFDPLGGIGIPKTQAATSHVGNLSATSSSAASSTMYIYNLASCGNIIGSSAVDSDSSFLTIENINYVIGNIAGSDLIMSRVGSVSGSIDSFNSTGITFCGSLNTISIAATSTYVAIAHVDSIASVSITSLQSTSSPLSFISVGEITSLTVSNTNGGASVTHPVVITNCAIVTLSFTNSTFGNTTLVTKDCNFTSSSLAKSIHKNFSGGNLIVNVVGLTAAVANVSIISGTAVGLDNLNKALLAVTVINTTSNAVTGGLKVGITSGGSEILSALAVGANASLYIDDSSILKRLFTSNPQNLFIAAVTSFNSSVLNLSFIFSGMK